MKLLVAWAALVTFVAGMALGFSGLWIGASLVLLGGAALLYMMSR